MKHATMKHATGLVFAACLDFAACLAFTACLVFSACLVLAPIAKAAPLKEHFAVDTDYNGVKSKVSVHTVFQDIGLDQYPVMFIVHGSGGQSHSRERWYADKFSELGVWSVITDHFRYRGVTDTVRNQSSVVTDTMVYDVFKVLDVIAKNKKVDMSRVGIMGFSKGGAVSLHTAIPSVQKQYSANGHKFTLHIPVYPSCTNQYFNAAATAPIYMLLGGKDEYTPPSICLDYAKKFEARGSKIKTIVYPEGHHAWDSNSIGVFKDPKGENYANCVIEEQADGAWKERITGLMVQSSGWGMNPQSVIPSNMHKAMQACRSYGVSYGGNDDVKYDALHDMKKIIAREFKLNAD